MEQLNVVLLTVALILWIVALLLLIRYMLAEVKRKEIEEIRDTVLFHEMEEAIIDSIKKKPRAKKKTGLEGSTWHLEPVTTAPVLEKDKKKKK